MTAPGRPAVFLDRDGTLIEEAGYLERLDRLAFFPFAIDAVRLLNRAGFAVVVFTNQAGIARGIVSPAFVDEAHAHIAARLAEGGAQVDAFYHCPHHPEGIVAEYRAVCDCRKPKPGMIRRAAADLSLDLSRSVTIGDRWQDVEAGLAAGTRGILVRTGYGTQEERKQRPDLTAALIADNLIEAASLVLRSMP